MEYIGRNYDRAAQDLRLLHLIMERNVAKMAGKIKNCPVCGKLYAEIGRKMCPDCFAKEQDKEKIVIDYVRDHRGAKIPEIVEETGASETLIKRLIREGRFEQIGIKVTYPCEKCGAPIIMGKMCQTCQDKARSELQAARAKIVAAKQSGNSGKGMYSKR